MLDCSFFCAHKRTRTDWGDSADMSVVIDWVRGNAQKVKKVEGGPNWDTLTFTRYILLCTEVIEENILGWNTKIIQKINY